MAKLLLMRTSWPRRMSIAGACTLVGIALAACGTPNAIAPSTTGTPSVTPTSASTSTTAPAPTCSTGVLSVEPAFANAAAGTSSYTFTVTNNGPSSCSLDGYPTLSFFAASAGGGSGAGEKLPITTSDSGTAPASVTLASKGTAQFRLSITDVPVNGAGCSTVASVDVTPSGGSESIPVPEAIQPCGPSVDVTAFTAG